MSNQSTVLRVQFFGSSVHRVEGNRWALLRVAEGDIYDGAFLRTWSGAL